MEKYKNYLRGFSLIELLISLIVISCITAAFTPLITKKFATNVFGGGAVSDITSECSKFGENCNLCTSNFCLSCNLSCNSDEYKDEKSCTCKKCSDKYGIYCNTCNQTKCLVCPEGEYFDEQGNCKPCSSTFTDCTSCTAEKCNTCQPGKILINPSSNTPCETFNCQGPDFIQFGSLCITKKNMGDGPALNIPSQVNITSAGNTCNVNEKNMCCWQGTTANPCDNTNGEGYHGCTRTICDYYAAKYICENFYAGGNTWRLATLSEMSTWKTNSVDIGVNGLQLCDNNSGYSSAYCKNAYNCPGSSSDCFPNSLWSSESADTSNTYIYYLENGIWNNSIKNNMDAYSVRCVTNFKSCIDKIGPGCLSCDGDTCLSCDFGYILTDGKCKLNCPEKYGKWCTECNDTECTGCNDAFKVGSNPSSTNACEFNCTGVNFMKINNICVTRKNMGDSELLTIPSSYQNSCYKTGNTNCNSNNSSYSGCNRTVCKRSTGRNICSAFNFDNRTWELPTRSDVSSWDDYSLGKGDEGLQLCTQNSGSSKANYCNTSSSYYPFRVWTRSTSSTSGDTEYIYYKLNTSDGWSSSKTSSGSGKYSIRCITDF